MVGGREGGERWREGEREAGSEGVMEGALQTQSYVHVLVFGKTSTTMNPILTSFTSKGFGLSAGT